jgi:hypothetical protein
MSAKIGKMFAKISENASKEESSKSVCETCTSSQKRRKYSRMSMKMLQIRQKSSRKSAKMFIKRFGNKARKNQQIVRNNRQKCMLKVGKMSVKNRQKCP